MRLPCRRFWRLSPTLTLSVTVLLAGVAGAKVRHDGEDARGSPLDVGRVGIEQSGPRLIIDVRTRGRWTPRKLKASPSVGSELPESYLCFELVQRGQRSRSCFASTSKGRARLVRMRVEPSGDLGPPTLIESARIRRPDRRSIELTLPARSAGLRVGRFGWRVISGWGEGGCLPAPEPPPEKGATPPRSEPRCTDAAPDGGLARAKLRKPRIVGCTRPKRLAYTNGGRERKRVALTFDDGPGPYTGRLMKVLDRNGARGTFFVVGDNVSGRASVLRRMHRHGHEIGNHSMHHGLYPSGADLRATNASIRAATGFEPCSFRPPYGLLNGPVATAARSLGMASVLWDVDPRDWSNPGAGTIYSRVVGAVRPGSIVITHDGGGYHQTLAALPSIISNLKRRGYRLVTVSRLLGSEPIWRP